MKRVAALVITGAMLAAGPALAQISGSGGPIDITADQLELIDAQHLAVWRGDVEALQGGNRLRADQVNIYFSGTGGASAGAPGRNWGPVQRIEANGKVFFVSPQQTARGNAAVYELGPNTITITGDVIVAQGQSVVHGDKLTIEVKSGRATMGSVAKGRNATGRVRGVFYPNSSNSNPLGVPPTRKQ
jgi:lipopolysaccharide export system protein LptA